MAAIETLTTEMTYNTKETDQEKGIQAAIAYGMKQGWDLISVIALKEDEKGHHHFTIAYNKVVPPTAKPKLPELKDAGKSSRDLTDDGSMD